MKNPYRRILLLPLLLLTCTVSAKEYRIVSPNDKLAVTVDVHDGELSYDVTYKGRPVLTNAPLSMHFSNGIVAGHNMRVRSSRIVEADDVITPVVPQKRSRIADHYRQLELRTADDYSVLFRVYDDGMAYRFATRFTDSVRVETEQVEYTFDSRCRVHCGLESSMFTHQEAHYRPIELSALRDSMIAAPPMIVTLNDGIRVLLTESDLEHYAGMYYTSDGQGTIRARFPNYVTKTVQPRDRDIRPVERADYIARTNGTRDYPWRVMIVTDRDSALAESDMVYKLASESRLDDTSWIRPGKVAWDWWTASRLYDVPFRSGVNTETYKAYNDFAAQYGLEYIIIDEGWYDLSDLMKVQPGIDIEELCAYGASKNVGIILWTTWTALDAKAEEAMSRFERWGVKGIKIDFMQRDDQWMVEWYYKTAEQAARHKLLVMYHGCYHPTGLQRTFPNVMTFEAVKGLENMKWSELPDPEHNATLPFTRMVQGPMDYTPGGMDNVHAREFKIRYHTPQTIGTRAHQLALYVIFESPLQMLADTPTAYEKEPVSMAFLEKVPSVWDQTRVIDGKIGEYIVTARRSAQEWYLGAITTEARTCDVALDFLEPDTEYEVTCWQDGPNVDVHARDVERKRFRVQQGDSLKIDMHTGGGYAAIVRKVRPEYVFTVKVLVDTPTLEQIGGMNLFKARLSKQFERINRAFNRPGYFDADYRFVVDLDAVELYEGNSRKYTSYPHPDHDYMIVMDGVNNYGEDGGGGWYGENQTIYHFWIKDEKGSDLLDTRASDGVIHEFGHARGVPDVYAMTVKAEKNPINGEGFGAVRSIMNYCYGETHWCPYSCNIINYTKGEMADINRLMSKNYPARFIVKARDAAGHPIRNATVKTYPVGWYEFDVKTTPAYTGTTDKTGTYLFDGNPFAPSIDGWGALAPLFLIEVTAPDGHKGYVWLPMYEVHFAGYNDSGDYVMNVTI